MIYKEFFVSFDFHLLSEAATGNYAVFAAYGCGGAGLAT
jgi:hypothetical protein